VKQFVLRGLMAAGLLTIGWVAGAQTSKPEFTLALDAPEGWTTVTCAEGCVLQGGRDLGLPGVKQSYYLKCGPADRCKGTINGWLKPAAKPAQ